MRYVLMVAFLWCGAAATQAQSDGGGSYVRRQFGYAQATDGGDGTVTITFVFGLMCVSCEQAEIFVQPCPPAFGPPYFLGVVPLNPGWLGGDTQIQLPNDPALSGQSFDLMFTLLCPDAYSEYCPPLTDCVTVTMP